MKTNRLLTLILSLSIFTCSVFAQDGKFKTPKFIESKQGELNQLIQNSTATGWLFFKKNTLITPQSYFDTYGRDYGLGEKDEMKLVKSEADGLGMSHFRFVQYHDGIEVEGGDYTLHYKEKSLVSAHGSIIEDFNLSKQSNKEAKDALKTALKAVGATKYVWQDPAVENQLKIDTKNSNATFLPAGEKVFTKTYNSRFVATSYHLAWRFRIKSLSPSMLQDVYVNATTDEVIKQLPLEVNTQMPFIPAYSRYGNPSLEATYRFPANDYYLYVDNQVHTKNYHDYSGDCTGSSTNNSSFHWNLQDNITTGNSSWDNDRAATTAHWGVQKTWEYFQNVLGRNGIDNGGKKFRVSVQDYCVKNNASFHQWDGVAWITVGNAVDNDNTFATLDIMAHEFTHGVTQNSSNLTYQGESGALNESFSDIMGQAVETYALGGNPDWIHGSDIGVAAFNRSFSDPHSSGGTFTRQEGGLATIPPQPDFYLTDPFWINTTTGIDRGGVHFNSGVQNRWFFLVASQIGLDKATRIAYRNLTTYLQPNSDYPAAREGAISAARDLYGDCSNEEVQVTNAWNQVGVGAPYNLFCMNLTGPYSFCAQNVYSDAYAFSPGSDRTYNLDVPADASVTWTVTNGFGFTLSNNDRTLTLNNNFNSSSSQGSFSVSATATRNGVTRVNGITSVWNTCGGGRLAANEKDKSQITVYPNPATSFIEVALSTSFKLPAQISITSVDGKQFMQKQISQKRSTVELGNIPTGTYVLTISGDAWVERRKILIIK